LKKAYILLLHGSRRPKEGEIEGIVKTLPEAQQSSVHVAYLELQKPSMAESFALCAENVDEVHVLPLFVLEGRHVREDIPEISQEMREKYPELNIVVHDHLGQWDLFSEMLNTMMTRL